jgi:hypothetical protein
MLKFEYLGTKSCSATSNYQVSLRIIQLALRHEFALASSEEMQRAAESAAR